MIVIPKRVGYLFRCHTDVPMARLLQPASLATGLEREAAACGRAGRLLLEERILLHHRGRYLHPVSPELSAALSRLTAVAVHRTCFARSRRPLPFVCWSCGVAPPHQNKPLITSAASTAACFAHTRPPTRLREMCRTPIHSLRPSLGGGAPCLAATQRRLVDLLLFVCSFNLVRGICRYQCFADQKEFEQQVQRKQPHKIDIGAVFTIPPKARHRIGWLDSGRLVLVHAS